MSTLSNYFHTKTCSKKRLAANIHLLKVNNENTMKSLGICSKLTIKTPERRH